MSEVISWLGNASYGVNGPRVKADIPVVFRPTDISGLQVWMDGNDANAVNFNEFGTCLSWFNKGDLSGNFDLSGTADVRYGENFVNNLNVVTFTENAYMIENYAMNFQDRSLFIVSRRNKAIDVSGVFTWLTADTTNAIESGILYDPGTSTFDYLISKHPGFAVELDFNTTRDTTGLAELASFVNSSTDLSANYVALNGTPQTAVINNLASGYATSSLTYFLGNYFGGSTLPNNYDLCELIMYDTALDATQIALVETYLKAKWAILDPIPTFVPSDISGLQVWLDADNLPTLDLSGTNIQYWSSIGAAGGSFAPGSNIASYSNGYVDFPTETTLVSLQTLPYYSRTGFCVFENKSPDLSNLTYPFINLMTTYDTDGRQAGFGYDSNLSTLIFTICQNGTNCPIVAPLAEIPPNLNLVSYVVDSNSYSNTYATINNTTLTNNSTDLGNLFNQSNIQYEIGAFSSNSPAFSVAEFIEYDSILSSNDMSNVKTYLSDKWGLGL